MIYFVRHGETDFNLFNISQGQLNTSLNYTGLKQAKEVAEKLKDKKFDIIFSSPITRAYQTAQEINLYHNQEIIFDNRLKEISKGSLESNKNSKQNYDNFFANPHKFGGETIEDVYKRVNSFLNDLKKYKNKKILIISHGGILGFFDFCLKNKDITTEKPHKIEITNCEIIEFDF